MSVCGLLWRMMALACPLSSCQQPCSWHPSQALTACWAGEGMKMSLFHLRKNINSRVYIFAHQEAERTVAVLGSDSENFASVTFLPIPHTFFKRPGRGSEADPVSKAEDRAATRNAIAKLCRLPASSGGYAEDEHSPYDHPGQLQQVLLSPIVSMQLADCPASMHHVAFSTCAICRHGRQ